MRITIASVKTSHRAVIDWGTYRLIVVVIVVIEIVVVVVAAAVSLKHQIVEKVSRGFSACRLCHKVKTGE